MKKIGLFYGSKGGNTESVAGKIYEKFDNGIIDMKSISELGAEELLNYENIILGVSTVGAETWDASHATNTWDTLFQKLKGINLDGKNFAVFGLGNQVQWPDHFIDDVAVVHKHFEESGANAKGKWPVDGYDHKESNAQIGDYFLGLAIDEDFQDEMTDERIEKWTQQIKSEFNL